MTLKNSYGNLNDTRASSDTGWIHLMSRSAILNKCATVRRCSMRECKNCGVPQKFSVVLSEFHKLTKVLKNKIFWIYYIMKFILSYISCKFCLFRILLVRECGKIIKRSSHTHLMLSEKNCLPVPVGSSTN